MENTGLVGLEQAPAQARSRRKVTAHPFFTCCNLPVEHVILTVGNAWTRSWEGQCDGANSSPCSRAAATLCVYPHNRRAGSLISRRTAITDGDAPDPQRPIASVRTKWSEPGGRVERLPCRTPWRLHQIYFRRNGGECPCACAHTFRASREI
jgi:hypothetical protein